jgi:hypothetical protein
MAEHKLVLGMLEEWGRINDIEASHASKPLGMELLRPSAKLNPEDARQIFWFLLPNLLEIEIKPLAPHDAASI